MAKRISTEWTGIPTKSKTASVKDHAPVRNVRVVHLSKATIRNSQVSGVFKVAEGAEVKTYAGKRRIEVECLWFGRKPPTTWMNITILCTPRFDENYSGNVAWDIRT